MTQTLRDDDERLRAIFDAALDAVISMDNVGLVTGWNTEAEKMFGYTREYVRGKSLAELIVPPSHRDAHNHGLKHFMETGEGPVLGSRIEITAMRSDQSEFPVELSIVVVRQDGDTFFSAFVRDITERKLAEQELNIAIAEQKESLRRAQRSELRYKILVGQAADAIFIFNQDDGRFVEVNQQACDSLGYTSEELLQMSIPDVSPGHDLASRRLVWATFETCKQYSLTATHRRKDGSIFPVEIHLAALGIDDEKLTMALVRDITERKHAEQEMQDQQDLINGLVDAAMDAVVSTDENQNITIFNHSAEQMFGHRAADVIGQPLDLLIPVRFRDKHRKHVDQFGKTGITT